MTEHRTDNATTTPPPRVPLIASAVEEEEPEDPKPAIEEACAQSAECKPVKARFDACNERVTAAGEGTEETCVEVSRWRGQ